MVADTAPFMLRQVVQEHDNKISLLYDVITGIYGSKAKEGFESIILTLYANTKRDKYTILTSMLKR